MNKITVCVVTGARSEYGLMRWLMEDLKNSSDFTLKLIAVGSHLSKKYGNTFKEIEADGFEIDKKIPFTVDPINAKSIGKVTGDLTASLVETFEDFKPDLILVMGDRYELLSVLSSSILSTIPVAHISGGEITEGAIDDQIRHAMTKISHLHYVANEVYKERVLQMGEENWRVLVCGEPGLDNLQRQEMMSKVDLEKDLDIDLSKPTALVTYHPVTLEIKDLDYQIKELVGAMEVLSVDNDLQFVITYPNSDEGSQLIIDSWKSFVTNSRERVLIKSLGQKRYLSALKYMSVLIGNSSSGLVEAPSFGLPVINIGNRQGGRIRGKNVIDVDYNSSSIIKATQKILKNSKKESYFNPYGNGNASRKILDHILFSFREKGRDRIISKKFIDSGSVTKIEQNFKKKYGH